MNIDPEGALRAIRMQSYLAAEREGEMGDREGGSGLMIEGFPLFFLSLSYDFFF